MKNQILKCSFLTLNMIVAGHAAFSEDRGVSIHLLDGQFSIVDGTVNVTEKGIIIEDATIRVNAGVIVSEPLGLTGFSAAEPSSINWASDILSEQVRGCWNVGSLNAEALRTSVLVKFSLLGNGKPDNGSIRMDSFSGGGDAAARQAFEAARRAIIRCGANGFNLPPEKYDQWRDIEMTFNPESMRIK